MAGRVRANIYGRGIPLPEAPSGIPLRVVAVTASGWGQMRRLLELGITPGTTIRVVRKELGPIVIEVRYARFALGRGLASRIIVEPLGAGYE